MNEPEKVKLCKDCPEPLVLPDEPTGMVMEHGIWRFDWLIEKFESDRALALGDRPYEEVFVEGNLLLTAGITRIMNRLIGVSSQALDNGNSRIGVGNSSSPALVGQTDLLAAAGSSNRQFVESDATYPSVSGGSLVWRATFPAGTGTFTWNEAGVDAGTANGTTVVAPLLNRKVISGGAKGAGSAWIITGTVTIT